MRKYKPYTYDGWFKYQHPNTMNEIKRRVPELFIKGGDTPENLCESFMVFWENNSLSDTESPRFSEAIEWMEEVNDFHSEFICNELLWIKYENR